MRSQFGRGLKMENEEVKILNEMDKITNDLKHLLGAEIKIAKDELRGMKGRGNPNRLEKDIKQEPRKAKEIGAAIGELGRLYNKYIGILKEKGKLI